MGCEAAQRYMHANRRINFKRILCPIGLTSDSDEGLEYALAVCRGYGAKLIVLYCAEEHEAMQANSIRRIKNYLENSINTHISHQALAAVESEIIIARGDPRIAIAQEAANQRIDLVVMRSRQRSGGDESLGSTAESVCRRAPCPVLVARQREQIWAGKPANEISLRRILVAYDFSSDSELALAYGLSLAQEFKAEIHLLHVLPPRDKPDAPEIAFLPFGVQRSVNEINARLSLAVPDKAFCFGPVKRIVREGHPYREALSYAEDQNIDLICMGASGTGFGLRALFGSNADRVMRQTPCPVLIARPLKPLMAAPKSAGAAIAE